MNNPITNAQSEKLDYTFHDAGSNAKTLVLIGHGVTGNKDRPWAPALGKALANAGCHALRFSFSGNGNSEGTFQDSTISKEVADLAAVITAAQNAGHSHITYAGHSMGGAVGVLAAAKDPRIQALISLAGMVHTAKFAQTEFGDVTPDQGNMWDDDDCPLSSTFVNDMTTIDTVLPLAPQVQVPWLLVHGTADDVVPIQESRDIFAQANQPKKLVEIPDADHVFSEQGLPPMLDAVIAWLDDPLAS
ncbi:MAG: alpha/beta fold hydrolase [Verrucomicrobiota bacterium]